MALQTGYPIYLERVTLPFWDWLDSELSNQTFLGDEMDMLLRIEFREPAVYWDILDAIGNGKTKQNEIGEYAHLAPTDLSPYIAISCGRN